MGIRADVRNLVNDLLVDSGAFDSAKIYHEPKAQIPASQGLQVLAIQTNEFRTTPINLTAHSASFDVMIVYVAGHDDRALVEDTVDLIRDVLIGGANAQAWQSLGVNIKGTEDTIAYFMGDTINRENGSSLACELIINVSVDCINYGYVAPEDQKYVTLGAKTDLKNDGQAEFTIDLTNNETE